jgi:copper chaperone
LFQHLINQFTVTSFFRETGIQNSKSCNSFPKLYKGLKSPLFIFVLINTEIAMEKIQLKTDLSCRHCVKAVEPILKNESGIKNYDINLEHPDKLVTIESEGADINRIIGQFNEAGYQAEKI